MGGPIRLRAGDPFSVGAVARGDDLFSNAAFIEREWQSEAASAAAAGLRELGMWYYTHAEHASAAGAACDIVADSCFRANATVPHPGF